MEKTIKLRLKTSSRCSLKKGLCFKNHLEGRQKPNYASCKTCGSSHIGFGHGFIYNLPFVYQSNERWKEWHFSYRSSVFLHVLSFDWKKVFLFKDANFFNYNGDCESLVCILPFEFVQPLPNKLELEKILKAGSQVFIFHQGFSYDLDEAFIFQQVLDEQDRIMSNSWKTSFQNLAFCFFCLNTRSLWFVKQYLL